MSERRSSQRGAVAILSALLLVMLTGFAGLAVDVGFMMLTRDRLQAFADAAALACANANSLTAGSCPASTSGQIAGLNVHGFAIDIKVGNSYCVTADQTGCLEAKASHTWHTFLMGVVGSPSVSLSATARAALSEGGPCLLALEGISSAGGTVTVNNCDIVSNTFISEKPDGTGPVKGTLSATGTQSGIHFGTTANCGSKCTPAARAAQPIADPLSALAKPGFPAYTCNNNDVTKCCAPGYAVCTLRPGNYPLGMKIGGNTVKFLPGAYNIGWKLELTSGGNATLAGGGGVTLFFELNDSKVESFAIMGGYVNLSAPTAAEAAATGGVTGILVWESKDSVSMGGRVAAGGANPNLSGNLYFPAENVRFSAGGTSLLVNAPIVAKTLRFDGGFTLSVQNTFPDAWMRARPVLIK